MNKLFGLVALLGFGVEVAAQDFSCEINLSSNHVCPRDEVNVAVDFFEPENYSLRFSGAGQGMEVANIPEYNFGVGDNFTIEFWMRTNQVEPDPKVLASKGSFAGTNIWFVALDDERIRFVANSGGTINLLSNSTLADNDWHHVAVVYNTAGNASIYIDGSLDNNTPVPGAMAGFTNNQPLTFGFGYLTGPTVPGAYYQGNMDEIRLWDRNLSVAEIQSRQMMHINPNVQNGLVGYWDFNEGGGAFAIDCALPQNDGFFMGTPSFQTIAPVLSFNFPVLWSTGNTNRTLNHIAIDTVEFWVESGYCKYFCTDTVTLFVIDCSELREINNEIASVWVPNAFSPNGDAKNETFHVKISEYVTDYEIRIYNRWGGLLFNSRDIEQPWDGTDFDGNEMPVGVYVYTILYKDQFNEQFRKDGHITLIR